MSEIQILRRQFKSTSGYDPTDWRAAESFADIVHAIQVLGEDPWIDDFDDDPDPDILCNVADDEECEQ